MKTLITFILVLLLYISALGFSEASERDWLGIPVDFHGLAVIGGGLILADWSQTLQIKDRPGSQEDNRTLGKQPDRGDVNRYFAMKLVGHVLINAAPISRKFKNIWNIYQIVITYDAVSGNLKAGLTIGF